MAIDVFSRARDIASDDATLQRAFSYIERGNCFSNAQEWPGLIQPVVSLLSA